MFPLLTKMVLSATHLSPLLKSLTSFPISVMTPTISWPGISYVQKSIFNFRDIHTHYAYREFGKKFSLYIVISHLLLPRMPTASPAQDDSPCHIYHSMSLDGTVNHVSLLVQRDRDHTPLIMT